MFACQSLSQPTKLAVTPTQLHADYLAALHKSVLPTDSPRTAVAFDAYSIGGMRMLPICVYYLDADIGRTYSIWLEVGHLAREPAARSVPNGRNFCIVVRLGRFH